MLTCREFGAVGAGHRGQKWPWGELLTSSHLKGLGPRVSFEPKSVLVDDLWTAGSRDKLLTRPQNAFQIFNLKSESAGDSFLSLEAVVSFSEL